MQATAFIVGPGDGSSIGISDLCLEIGFRAVVAFSKLEQAEQQVKRTPICFFLFNADADPEQIMSISKAIRFSRNRQVRFAPMVCFAENPDHKTANMCIQSGFDDIVVPPFAAARIGERLENLLERRLMFFETPDYFGPDRRNRPGTHKSQHHNRGKGGDHRRIEITRNVDSGINILHDHFYRRGVRQTSERTMRMTNSISVTRVAV